ncbi:MAG: N-acetylornithine carbamoyltransferase [Chloroflexi bacterium]|nr:N-acetylornithine carbamoyltransferase [Chloroflexota bacterium]
MKTDTWKNRDWITTFDYTKEELETILHLAFELKERFNLNEPHDILARKTLFMIFYNGSLRTRNSFEAGMTQLGGHAHFLDTGKIYAPTFGSETKDRHSEDIADTARTLSRMGHGISIRCFGDAVGWRWGMGNQVIREFAKWSDIPVINMEDDWYHPCQAMADIMTIKEKLGELAGKKLVMSWAYAPDTKKPLSVAHSMLPVASKFDMEIVLAHPKGYDLNSEVISKVKNNVTQFGGSFTTMDDMDAACEGADVIYAKSWTATQFWLPIQEKLMEAELKSLAEKNKDWICDSRRMALAKKGAIYLHCLPCNRDFEVTADVIDGPQSAVFDEAENRLHAQKAIMALLMK